MVFYDGDSKGRVVFRGINTDAEYSVMVKFYRTEGGKISYTEIGDAKCVKEATETAQIPTNAAKVENEPQEETNEAVKHISEIIESRRLYDDNRNETDEYKYYKWLTNAHCGHYRTIAENALVEVLTGIFEAAYRKGKGHIIAINKDGVLIETIIATIQPPQPPEITETINYTIESQNALRSQPNRLKQAVRNFRTTKPRTINSFLIIANVPRDHGMFHGWCSTMHHFAHVRKMILSPPVRDGCISRCRARAKPPNTAKTNNTSNFKPP